MASLQATPEQRTLIATLTAQFGNSIQVAAKNLGYSVSKLRRTCREVGIVRWPYKTSSTVQRHQCFDFHLTASPVKCQQSPPVVFVPQSPQRVVSSPVVHGSPSSSRCSTPVRNPSFSNLETLWEGSSPFASPCSSPSHETNHANTLLRNLIRIDSPPSSPARLSKPNKMKNLTLSTPVSDGSSTLPSYKQLLLDLGLSE